jgi:GNAT superfamily N-acetyltransferase
MPDTVAGVEVYRAAFARRSVALAAGVEQALDEPGICGVVGSADHPRGRLLVTDDRAAATLERLLPDLRAKTVIVFTAAARCRDLFESAGPWEGDEVTAMLCQDLEPMPTVAAPSGLTIRDVRRLPTDPTDGVPLEPAVQACLEAEPESPGPPLSALLAFLRSMPAPTRLLAGVDDEGVVRATAGCSAFGADALCYFVSTDAQWRRQGVATAMTAAALTWARQTGARAASLEASPAGLSIYRRLGFEAVSPATMFVRLG